MSRTSVKNQDYCVQRVQSHCDPGVWLVYNEIDFVPPTIPKKATVNFFKGVDSSALSSKGLRALIYCDHPDGSLIIYDTPVERRTAEKA